MQGEVEEGSMNKRNREMVGGGRQRPEGLVGFGKREERKGKGQKVGRGKRRAREGVSVKKDFGRRGNERRGEREERGGQGWERGEGRRGAG